LGSVVSGLLSSSSGKGMPWPAGDGKQPINKLLQALRERQASQQAASAQVCRRCKHGKEPGNVLKLALLPHEEGCAHGHHHLGAQVQVVCVL
jgi:hypothetical protein